jgi:hypothetical protein
VIGLRWAWRWFAAPTGRATFMPRQVVRFEGGGPWDGMQVFMLRPYRPGVGVPAVAPPADASGRLWVSGYVGRDFAGVTPGPHVYSRHEMDGRLVYRYEGQLPPWPAR